MSVNLCRFLSLAFGFIVAAIGLLLGFYIFPNIVNQKIDESVKLLIGTEGYERWETIPIPLHFKVYFFNVTNPDEVQLGGKPQVKEIGPYVYEQWRYKYDIKEEIDTLSYYQNQLFRFNEVASQPNKENDQITVANLPLMVVSTIAEARAPFFASILNKRIGLLFNEPKNLFLTTTVRHFLFDGIDIACKNNMTGIEKRVCSEIERQASIHLQKLADGRFRFSLLSYKNNSHDGYYKINSGIKDIDSLGNIITWQNSSTLTNWQNNSDCNNIYGTDTSIFPPHRTPQSNLVVFQSDICRTIKLHYNNKVEYKDISGLRYIVQRDMLDSAVNFSSNSCFCLKKAGGNKNTKGITGEDGCLLDGAMELWSCQDVPIVLTLPHFYLAHEKYTITIDGLNPNRTLHETFVDLEPNSGTVLRGSKRVQFNIFYRKIAGIDLTQNLTDSLMPVVWVDEGVELTDKYINLLNDKLFYPIKILDGVFWALIGFGLSVGLLNMIWCIVFTNKNKNVF